jgi:riboflavin kinase/FMN adenylyltransferase
VSDYINSVVALGTFDGVHKGHHHLIDTLLKEAKRINATPIIVTFFPHPTHILTPDKPLKLINSIEERKILLQKKGIRTIIIKEFTKEFSNKPAIDFIKNFLIQELKMKMLIVGFDHSFGKDKEGDYETLKIYGKQLEFSVKQVDAFIKDDKKVSSSLIRKLILSGEIEKANKLLDYTFCLFGKVVKGNQLGRKIGFRTANIELDYPNKIVPKTGVYVVQSRINNKIFYGMMNIGYRPTVQGTKRTIEVHYFDIQKNLYNQNLKVKVLHRLRDEFKFENIEMLKNQLFIDKEKSIMHIKSL